MKKHLLIALLATIGSSAFAYSMTVKNQSTLTVSVKAAGNTVCTINPNSTSYCNLSSDTTYEATYPTQWSTDRIFSIQKNSDMVLQTTPRTANAAFANFIIDVDAHNGNNGSVDTFLNSNGGISANGSCRPDNGGVTCMLARGTNLQNLDVTLTGSFKPTPTPTPAPTPSGKSVHDYGNWNNGQTYTVLWSPSTVYPVVSYEGKRWIACSEAAAGGRPGHSAYPDTWNPWVEYSGNPAQC